MLIWTTKMNSLMRLLVVPWCSGWLGAAGAWAAPIQLREAVNTVMVSESRDAAGRGAASHSSVSPGQFVRTGTDSRADLAAGPGALRLGSQTVIRVPADRGDVQLEQGTVLFDGWPKDAALTVTIEDKPIVVAGGTGFAILTRTAEGHPASLHIGSVAGRTKVSHAGHSITLSPAQVLSLQSDGSVRLGAFDLSKQVESSALVHGFKTPLSGSRNVRREAARFASLQRRGFVEAQSLPAAAFHADASDGSRAAGARSGSSAKSAGTFAAIASQNASGTLGVVQTEGIGLGAVTGGAGRTSLAAFASEFGLVARSSMVVHHAPANAPNHPPVGPAKPPHNPGNGHGPRP
jgi:hypothetical protein